VAGERGEQGLRGITEALVEVLVAIPVYRLYVVPGEPAGADVVAAWDDVVAAALARAPHRAAELELVRDLALGRLGRGDGRDEFVVRFQQTCGPAVAKGVEDTAGYRWSPVGSLNEVGSDPDRLGLRGPELHRWASSRARTWPSTMNALSTHDTKRSEDVRARITTLTEAPERFLACVDSWSARLAGVERVEPGLAWLLWQTLVGAHPISVDRLQGFLLKAARESKLRTSWLAPDAAYEREVQALAAAAVADSEVLAEVQSLLVHLEPAVVAGVLGQRALQLVVPGVPDIYQGCEALSLRLVDPDNRERPDWGALRASLHQALLGPVDPMADLSLAKLRLTALGLRLRRERPASFGPGSAYTPIGSTGARAEHVVGVLRTDVAVSTTRLALRLQQAGGWRGTRVDLPDGRWVDLLSGQEHRASGGVPAAELHESSPVALLVRAG
jgi:(1->4)-alpha-D-glucan 1-alpha-D-glucosylmutase